MEQVLGGLLSTEGLSNLDSNVVIKSLTVKPSPFLRDRSIESDFHDGPVQTLRSDGMHLNTRKTIWGMGIRPLSPVCRFPYWDSRLAVMGRCRTGYAPGPDLAGLSFFALAVWGPQNVAISRSS